MSKNNELPSGHLPEGHELHDTSDDICAAHDEGNSNCFITRCDTCEKNNPATSNDVALVHHDRDPNTHRPRHVDMTKNYDPNHPMFKHHSDGTQSKFEDIVNPKNKKAISKKPTIGQQFKDIMRNNGFK
jgi:hypothetical protein